MSYYPTAIPNTTNYPDRTDDVDWIYAARYNEIKNEVIALAKELGVSPSGSQATVVARLNLTLQNLSEDTTPELGGEMDCGEFTIGFTEKANVVVSNLCTIDWKDSNKQKLTVDANVTVSFTAPSNPCTLTLRIIQSGAANVTTLPTLKTVGGAAITISATNGAIDIVTLYYDGTSYYAIAGLLFS